jgi:hypothetical protein
MFGTTARGSSRTCRRDIGSRVEAELLLCLEAGDVLLDREPASDDTSIRNSEPMYTSQSDQAPASAVPVGR